MFLTIIALERARETKRKSCTSGAILQCHASNQPPKLQCQGELLPCHISLLSKQVGMWRRIPVKQFPLLRTMIFERVAESEQHDEASVAL